VVVLTLLLLPRWLPPRPRRPPPLRRPRPQAPKPRPPAGWTRSECRPGTALLSIRAKEEERGESESNEAGGREGGGSKRRAAGDPPNPGSCARNQEPQAPRCSFPCVPAAARTWQAAVVQQRVDERPRVMPRADVHDHPGGLVDYHQVLVLKDNVQGDGLRDRLQLYVPEEGREGGGGEGGGVHAIRTERVQSRIPSPFPWLHPSA
jgi:hypothetical protein